MASSEPHGKVFESAKEPFAFELPKGECMCVLCTDYLDSYA